MASLDKVAVVTGANKGIGLAIAEKLAREGCKTVLTARNPALGEAAASQLRSKGLTSIVFHECDITKKDSVDGLARWLEAEHGGFDILVNNAGFAFKGSVFGAAEARETLGINYHGTVTITERMLPLMRKKGRIVNVSSRAGYSSQVSPALQKKFLDPNLTKEELDTLMDKFVADIEAGKHTAEGWSNSMYGISKLGVTSYTRLLAKRLAESDDREIFVNACCPGYCRTDMSSNKGPRSPEEGADTPVWLALSPPKTGAFWGERNELQM